MLPWELNTLSLQSVASKNLTSPSCLRSQVPWEVGLC